MSEEKLCFVIAPIGQEGSETRKRSDQIFKHVITPPVEELGYKPIRADQISEPGPITSQVIEHIIDDSLVIADLTDRNPNVFYELAIRHAIRKPLVQIMRKNDPIPFDVAGMRTIFVDHRDLDSVEEAKSEIKAQIEALEEGSAEIKTPISMALDLQMLRRSEDPGDRSLGEILAAISEVRTSVALIERVIFDAELQVRLDGGLGISVPIADVWRRGEGEISAKDVLEGLSVSEKARMRLKEVDKRACGDKSVDEGGSET